MCNEKESKIKVKHKNFRSLLIADNFLLISHGKKLAVYCLNQIDEPTFIGDCLINTKYEAHQLHLIDFKRVHCVDKYQVCEIKILLFGGKKKEFVNSFKICSIKIEINKDLKYVLHKKMGIKAIKLVPKDCATQYQMGMIYEFGYDMINIDYMSKIHDCYVISCGGFCNNTNNNRILVTNISQDWNKYFTFGNLIDNWEFKNYFLNPTVFVLKNDSKTNEITKENDICCKYKYCCILFGNNANNVHHFELNTTYTQYWQRENYYGLDFKKMIICADLHDYQKI